MVHSNGLSQIVITGRKPIKNPLIEKDYAMNNCQKFLFCLEHLAIVPRLMSTNL